MTDDPHDVAGIPDPVRRAQIAGEQVQRHQRLMNEFARLRREAIEELRSQGLSFAAVAEALGVSRARVAQLRTAGPPPERAFLGSDTLTIAIPARPVDGRAHPVVAAEDLQAAESLGAFARTVGLETKVVHIPPDGRIPLDAEELVVICGPKNSPDVRALLDQNPHHDIREQRDGTWAIVDRGSGEVLASPLDERPETREDMAYIARVPRPDRAGTVLHIAGIHAIGSLGAVHYLAENLSELHRKIGVAPFSLVVRSRSNEASAIVDAEAVVPAQGH